ncbi:ferritin-like domain-containing protein [Marinospirillum insulare]|uniref:DUF2202 domain-containing protein n=1 Tax=Marinospirillum insulare TaxID=217169 RepID=A0ABQ5ZRF2_9GAMM|nr:hypothetical protein [Marinospirillum insulare]GLR62725.1 hypothetical protein GCM10007878_01600 [Marinospirillum insulare]
MPNLSETEINALHEALDDEYKAWSTYDQVLNDFGEVRPFSNIRDAEGRHIEALKRLFVRYGVPIPDNPYPRKIASFTSLQEACEAGVEDEIANAELYERLFAATERGDILMVLENLQRASQERHLPAFQRCVEGRGLSGRGKGTGRGKGQSKGRGCGKGQ